MPPDSGSETYTSAQVLIIIVIAFGSVLNLLAKPWSSTDSTLERRRNDLVSIFLWMLLICIAAETVRRGIHSFNGPDAFDLQDWTALVLPFALAAPYLLELAAILVRQLEMWQWMRRATIQTLPIAWMYRTMTVGETDKDGAWLASRDWMPARRPARSGFWHCTSRKATLFHIFRRWMQVLLSSWHYAARSLRAAVRAKMATGVLVHTFIFVLVSVLLGVTAVMLAISLVEVGLLLAFDYAWWYHCNMSGIIVSVYSCVHFGRDEMQLIFDHSARIRSSLLPSAEGIDADHVHDQIMGALITTAAVLENAFRNAYLVTPIYTTTISDRKALRDMYDFVGCDLDKLIKAVRVVLELKHTAGLMSITSAGGGTVEAALHNRIESILSVALFFEPRTLYTVASRIAQYECQVEERVRGNAAEEVTRERVVYIDARNAVFWLLWILVTRDWRCGTEVWGRDWEDRDVDCHTGVENVESDANWQGRCDELWVDSLYVVATFLSRCRYAKRFGIGKVSERGLFTEVKSLCATAERRAGVAELFEEVSSAVMSARGFDLITWTEQEYGLQWVRTRADGSSALRCCWRDVAGNEASSECALVMEE